MQALFFGSPERQLLGVYHPPQGERAREAAVLLCAPPAWEYMRSHWALRKLAGQLAREGLHVLRFDWSGTGDSAGELEGATVAAWCEDLRTAAAELQDLSGTRRLSVVGLRLGSALALRAACDGLAVRDLVLWEPVGDGRAHLRELRAVETARYRRLLRPPRQVEDELLGHPLPAALAAELERLDARTFPPCGAERILLFAAARDAAHEALRSALAAGCAAPPELRVVPEDAADAVDGVLQASAVLREITLALAAA